MKATQRTVSIEAFEKLLRNKKGKVYVYVQLVGTKYSWLPAIKSELLSNCQPKKNGFASVTITEYEGTLNIFIDHFNFNYE